MLDHFGLQKQEPKRGHLRHRGNVLKELLSLMMTAGRSMKNLPSMPRRFDCLPRGTVAEIKGELRCCCWKIPEYD